MCGIAGILAAPGRTTAIDDATLARMGDAIAHRGPDDAGSWSDADAGIALVHRRLAVIDLSAAGHQPMASHCGRYVVVYNGELYNHPELRQALGDLPWRGHSDTETLLALFTRHGVVAALPALSICSQLAGSSLWLPRWIVRGAGTQPWRRYSASASRSMSPCHCGCARSARSSEPKARLPSASGPK